MLKKCIAAVLFLLFTSSICHKSPVEPEPANVVAEKFEEYMPIIQDEYFKFYKTILFNSGNEIANNIILEIQWTNMNENYIDTLRFSLADLYLPQENFSLFPHTKLQKYGNSNLSAKERTQELWFARIPTNEYDPIIIGTATILNLLWD